MPVNSSNVTKSISTGASKGAPKKTPTPTKTSSKPDPKYTTQSDAGISKADYEEDVSTAKMGRGPGYKKGGKVKAKKKGCKK